jgi:hypothetical protein
VQPKFSSLKIVDGASFSVGTLSIRLGLPNTLQNCIKYLNVLGWQVINEEAGVEQCIFSGRQRIE